MQIPEPVRPTPGRVSADEWRRIEEVFGDEIPFTASMTPPHRYLTRTEVKGWPSDKVREARDACRRSGLNPYLEEVCDAVLRHRAGRAGSE